MILNYDTELAQLEERSTFNRVVVGSSPIYGDTNLGIPYFVIIGAAVHFQPKEAFCDLAILTCFDVCLGLCPGLALEPASSIIGRAYRCSSHAMHLHCKEPECNDSAQRSGILIVYFLLVFSTHRHQWCSNYTYTTAHQ